MSLNLLKELKNRELEKRFVVLMATFLIISVFITGIYLSSDYFLEEFRVKLVNFAEEELETEIEIDRLTLQRFNKIRAEEVTIYDQKERKLISSPQLTMDYSFLAYIFSGFEPLAIIKSFNIESPELNVIEDDTGYNFLFIFKNIDLAEVEIPIVHQLKSDGYVNDGRVNIDNQHFKDSITGVDIKVEFGEVINYFATGQLLSQQGKIKLDGQFEMSNYKAKLEILDFDLAKLKSATKLDILKGIDLTGDLSGAGKIEGNIRDEFRLANDLEVELDYLAYDGQRIEDIKTELKVTDYGIELYSLKGRYLDSSVRVSGNLFDWLKPELYLDYQISDLALSEVKDEIFEIVELDKDNFEIDGNANLSGHLKGDLWNPEITAELSLRGAKFEGVEFDSLAGRLNYNNGSLNLEGLEADLYQGSIFAEGDIIFADELSYLLDFDLENLDVNDLNKFIPGDEIEFVGLAGGNIIVSGKLTDEEELNLIGNADFTKGKINGYQFEQFNSDFWLSNGNILLNNTTLVTDNSKYQAEGLIGLDGTLNLIWQLENALLFELEEFHGVNDLMASIDGDGVIEGDFSSPQINGEFTASDLSYDIYNISQAQGRFEYVDGQFDFNDVIIPEINTDLSGDFNIDDQTSKLNLTINRTDINNFKNLIDFDFDFNSSGIVSGKAVVLDLLSDADGSGEFLWEQGSVNGQLFDSIELEAAYNNQQVMIDKLVAQYNESYFKAGGSYKDEELDIEFGSDSFYLADIEHESIGKVLDGDLEIEGRLYGPVDDFRVAAWANGDNIKLNGHSVANLHGNINYKDQDLYINDITVKLRNNSYKANGSINLYQQEINNLLITTREGELRDIDQFFDIDLDINHKFAGTVRARGPLLNPRGDLDILVHEKDSRGKLELSGDYWLGHDMDFNIRASHFNLDAINKLELLPYDVTGILNLQGEMTGNLNSINLDSNLKVREGTIGGLAYQELGGRIRVLESSLVSVDQELIVEGNNAIKAYGQIPLQEGRNFDFDIELEDGNLSFLPLWVPEVKEAQGRGRAQIRLTGTWARPRLAGEAEISAGSLDYQLLHRKIDELRGNINFEDNRISIESLHGNYGDGNFEIDGRIVLDRLIPDTVDLNMDAKNIVFEHGSWQGKNNGQFRVSGDFTEPLISGEFTARDTFFRLPVEWPVGEGGSEPLIKPSFDLTIKPGDNVRVGNRNINIRVQTGSLNLVGPMDNIDLVGRLESRSGQFLYYNTMFELEEGSAEFRRQSFIPNLNIRAATQIEGERVELNLRGPADRMEFDFGSAEGLEQTEVVSKLVQQGGLGSLLDKDYEDIIQDEMWRLINEGLRIELLSRVERTFEEGLDLDQVRIRTVLGQQIMEVAFGKYVINNLLLKYEHSFGIEEKQAVGFEYSFNRGIQNLTIEGNYDNHHNYDMSLDYRIPF